MATTPEQAQSAWCENSPRSISPRVDAHGNAMTAPRLTDLASGISRPQGKNANSRPNQRGNALGMATVPRLFNQSSARLCVASDVVVRLFAIEAAPLSELLELLGSARSCFSLGRPSLNRCVVFFRTWRLLCPLPCQEQYMSLQPRRAALGHLSRLRASTRGKRPLCADKRQSAATPSVPKPGDPHVASTADAHTRRFTSSLFGCALRR